MPSRTSTLAITTRVVLSLYQLAREAEWYRPLAAKNRLKGS